jgi:hypothetical protein
VVSTVATGPLILAGSLLQDIFLINKYHCILPLCTGSDEINSKLTWMGAHPHAFTLSPPSPLPTAGHLHHQLQPPQASSTISSSHRKPEHQRPHGCTASSNPLSRSRMCTRGLVTKFKTTSCTLIFN